MKDIIYTNHALNRFKERFPELVVPKQHIQITVRNLFQKANPENSFKNDTRLMVRMLEEHGHCDFAYYTNGDVLFAVRENFLATVMHVDMSKRLTQTASRFKKTSRSA